MIDARKSSVPQPSSSSPTANGSSRRASFRGRMVERWKSAVRRLRESLAVRNGEDNGPTKKEPGPAEGLLCDGEPPPSIEEIQSWGKSFDKLMRSTAGRKVFRDFLRCEYSEENILFWLACEELKRESNPDAVEEKARFIYEDYISILSPKEVSLDSRVREVVNRNMVEPTPHTFDEAQLQIYTLMHRDSYPRFVNSALYKTLAQVASSSSPAGAGSDEEEPGSPDSCHQEGGPCHARGGPEENKEIAESKPEKKEITTDKKGVTWEKMENTSDKELKKEIADKKDSTDKKSPANREEFADAKEEKKELCKGNENNLGKKETIQLSLNKDLECKAENKPSPDSLEKKSAAGGGKDPGLSNNLA